MSAKRASAVAMGVMVAGAAGILGWQWWQTPRGDTAGERAARGLSAGIVAAMQAAEDMVEPYRCARPSPGPSAATPEGSAGTSAEASTDAAEMLYVGTGTNRREARMDGHTLRLSVAEGRPVHVAVVADARMTTDGLAAIRDDLAALPARRAIDLVVSLGGMASDRQGIETALSTLAGPWFLVALPGDWESYAEHRRAVTALADQGVVDGARARVIALANAARIATLPGVAHRERSLADLDACVYTDEDVARLPELFARAERGAKEEIPRVLVSHDPPRQRGAGATDLSAAGVHIGETALADALTSADIGLNIHGLVVPDDVASGDRRVTLDPKQPLVLAAGAADGVANIAGEGKWPPRALVITLDSGSVTWAYLEKK